LTGSAERERFQIGDFRFEILKPIKSLQQTEHRANFTSRTARYVNEREKLLSSAALEALGDVI
jgi:hypothetical protein